MQATEQHRIQTHLRKTFRFALIGLLFGFLGLGIATYRMAVEAAEPTPAKTEQISEVFADTLKKTADKLRNRPEPERTAQWTQSKKLALAASVCGFVGAVFGCVSWLKAEHRRWTWAAVCVGITALAWTHVVVAVALAVGFAIFISILGKM